MIQKKRSVNRLNLGWKRRVESRITSRFLARTTRRPEVTFAKDELGLGINVSGDTYNFYHKLFLKTWNESQLDKQPN